MKKESHHRRYRRVILKLSGEFFSNKDTTFHKPSIEYAVQQITSAKRMGTKIGIVVGAGNIIRGRDTRTIDKIDADLCGMMGTVINGLILCSMLKQAGHRAKVSSALAIDGIAERFNKFKDLEFYDSGGVVVFVGGTGNPLFTTDTAAALRAAEFDVDILIKGTKVAGVYSSDPHQNRNAIFYKTLTYRQVITKNLQVMDLAAFNICRETGIPICVYSFMEYKLSDVISGKKVGTFISGG